SYGCLHPLSLPDALPIYRPQLIVGNPDQMSADVLKSGAQVVLPADADGHANGLERIQDLGIGAMTFPAAGSAADLALLLVDHHRSEEHTSELQSPDHIVG